MQRTPTPKSFQKRSASAYNPHNPHTCGPHPAQPTRYKKRVAQARTYKKLFEYSIDKPKAKAYHAYTRLRVWNTE